MSGLARIDPRPVRAVANDRKIPSVGGMSTLETIVEELRTLPPPKLAEAAGFIHHLKETSRAERLAALERSAGILSAEDGAELERIIEEGCEKIDARDW